MQPSACSLMHLAPLLLVLSACAANPAPTRSDPAPQPYLVTISHGNKAVIPQASLTIELVAVTDNRCPQDVKCVWAGHASVSVRQSGSAAETLVIGTPSLPGMNLPFEASYGAYRFSLVELDPPKSSSSPTALADYRVTLRITPIPH